MKFAVYQASSIGGRKYNQDRVAYAYSENALLLVLADGMGGHLHGEIAAQIAIQTFMQSFAQAAQPHVPEPEEYLRNIMRSAHEAITQYAHAQHLGGNPGTTCVAALMQDGQACWAHAGDSRCYLLRGGKMVAVTRDHSAVQQWADWGLIKHEEMKMHPDRNRITNCLGGVEDMFYAESSPAVPMQPGDVLLLCSDGLWGPLAEADIVTAFSSAPLAAALDQLMDKALLLGGAYADNTTAVVARWGDAEDEQPAPAPVCVVLEVEQPVP
ncbi:MAG: serine/threonine-protein phosphatase [Betaproteobacteria bacterium]|nr:serine/threonine-protein phosphatase [Betaproteobacteria bacterium]